MTKQAEENEIEKANWHWRNTMRPIRFFNWDARAGAPFVILLVFPRIKTILLCIVVCFIFSILEKKGLTFPSALRALRVAIIGNARAGWVASRRRRFTEFR